MREHSEKAIVWQVDTTPPELQAVLRTLAEEYPIHERAGGGIRIRFAKSAQTGVCRVERNGQEALVTYGLPSLAIRAIGSLLGGVVAEKGVLEETSPFTTFGIMLDCSRNAVMRVEHLQRWFRRLALLGYNQAMLYTEDTYALPDEPCFGLLRGAYTREELKTLDDYAYRLGIELVPCIQTLGHLEQMLKWPAYRGVKDTTSVLMAGEEKTYALIEKMITHWAGIVRSRRIHLGMDETHDLGRGRYLDRNGYRPGFTLFNEHLAKVTAIARRHGLKPMIWSDMYFRLGSANNNYYDRAAVIPESVKQQIPPEIELVYWDYYHDTTEFYLDWIERHRKLGHEPLMASGIWSWTVLWYQRKSTEANAGACIDACRQAKVREIFFTLWQDDGAYSDFDSALAGVAFAAERAFAGNVSNAALEKRFHAVCGGSYAAHLTACTINDPVYAAPVLWDDPLLGLFLRNPAVHAFLKGEKVQSETELPAMENFYHDLAQRLEPLTEDRAAGDLRQVLQLARVLAEKIRLERLLADAYAARDRQALAEIRQAIPRFLELFQAWTDSFRLTWLKRNKPFGLEIMQHRVGGLAERYRELSTRLGNYLDGTIDAIPELEPSFQSQHGAVPPSFRYSGIASACQMQ